jgi:hypothetical protein
LNVLAKREDWGQLGAEMRALANDKQRAFVENYLLETYSNKNKDNYGAQATAARLAGFGGEKATPLNLARTASRLMRDERIVAAIIAESRKYLRALTPEAVKALHAMIRNPEHPGHVRAVGMSLDRSDPITTRQEINVTHKTIDMDQEGIEELRALRKLGVSREKMIETFGGNGLARLEALEAADTLKRANEAKIIDGEAIEVEDKVARNSESGPVSDTPQGEANGWRRHARPPAINQARHANAVERRATSQISQDRFP